MQFCTHERATEGGSFFGFLNFFSKYSMFPIESLHILFSSFLWQVYIPRYPIRTRIFFKIYWIFNPIFYFSPSESLYFLFLSFLWKLYFPWYPIRTRFFFPILLNICRNILFSPSRISTYFVLILPIFGICSLISDQNPGIFFRFYWIFSEIF